MQLLNVLCRESNKKGRVLSNGLTSMLPNPITIATDSDIFYLLLGLT